MLLRCKHFLKTCRFKNIKTLELDKIFKKADCVVTFLTASLPLDDSESSQGIEKHYFCISGLVIPKWYAAPEECDNKVWYAGAKNFQCMKFFFSV